MKSNILFVHLIASLHEDIKEQFENKSNFYSLITMPMGILYLSSSLKKFEADCVGEIEILDYPLEFASDTQFRNIEEFIRKPAEKIKFQPDIISITLMFNCQYLFFELCVDQFKKIWPNSIVIVGGNQATNCTKQLMQNQNVDYTLRGEGEITFPQFVRCISNSIPPFKIKGLYSRENYNPDTYLDVCDMIANLDEIPYPDWDLINMDKYSALAGGSSGGAGRGHRCASIFTSRGCPFHCTFCSSHTVHGRKMRYRSVENVIQEVKLLYEKYGVDAIIIQDDLITSDKRTLEIFRLLKKINIPNFKMVFPILSINASSTELLDVLFQSGMNDVCLALESGSEYTQTHIIKKNVNLKKARELVEYLKKYENITVKITLILGFPRETKDLMSESIEYAKSLKADWIMVAVATPLPGTEMFKEFVAMGCIDDDLVALSKSLKDYRSFDTPEIKADELNDLCDLVNLEYNFFKNRDYILGNYQKAIDRFSNLCMNYPWHIIALYMIWKCYQKLDNNVEAENTKLRISNLIHTNKKSKEMFEKHKEHIPEFV